MSFQNPMVVPTRYDPMGIAALKLEKRLIFAPFQSAASYECMKCGTKHGATEHMGQAFRPIATKCNQIHEKHETINPIKPLNMLFATNILSNPFNKLNHLAAARSNR